MEDGKPTGSDKCIRVGSERYNTHMSRSCFAWKNMRRSIQADKGKHIRGRVGGYITCTGRSHTGKSRTTYNVRFDPRSKTSCPVYPVLSTLMYLFLSLQVVSCTWIGGAVPCSFNSLLSPALCTWIGGAAPCPLDPLPRPVHYIS